MTSRWKVAGLLGLLCLSAGERPARAVENYIPSDFTLLTDDLTKTLVQTVAIGTDHRAYSAATPLGVMLGIELGVDVTGIKIPADFKSAIVLTSGVSADSVPDLVPVPTLQIRKGFPLGVDVGFSYSHLATTAGVIYNSMGGDIQWAFLRNKMKAPTLALRVSYASEKLFFIKSHQYSFDLVASKRLFIIDPYVGAGFQVWSGELDVPEGVPTGTVTLTKSGNDPRFFVGLPLKLLVLKFTAEAAYSLGKIVTYGGKFSFSF